MPTRIDGDNVTVPGQVSIAGQITSLSHALTEAVGGRKKAYVQALNLNAAGPIDLAVLTVPSTKYIPLAAYVYNPSANVSNATLGLYTAAGGGGTAIIAPTLLATLTATTKWQSLSIAAITDAVTAGTLYPRLTVAAGVAGTASLVLLYLDLQLI